MSTGFYRKHRNNPKRPDQLVGTRSARANHTGYRFMWAILPMDLLKWWMNNDDYTSHVFDDDGTEYTMPEFVTMIALATFQGYDPDYVPNDDWKGLPDQRK